MPVDMPFSSSLSAMWKVSCTATSPSTMPATNRRPRAAGAGCSSALRPAVRIGATASTSAVTLAPPARCERRSASGGAATRGLRGRGTPRAQSSLHRNVGFAARFGGVVAQRDAVTDLDIAAGQTVVVRRDVAAEVDEPLILGPVAARPVELHELVRRAGATGTAHRRSLRPHRVGREVGAGRLDEVGQHDPFLRDGVHRLAFDAAGALGAAAGLEDAVAG